MIKTQRGTPYSISGMDRRLVSDYLRLNPNGIYLYRPPNINLNLDTTYPNGFGYVLFGPLFDRYQGSYLNIYEFDVLSQTFDLSSQTGVSIGLDLMDLLKRFTEEGYTRPDVVFLYYLFRKTLSGSRSLEKVLEIYRSDLNKIINFIMDNIKISGIGNLLLTYLEMNANALNLGHQVPDYDISDDNRKLLDQGLRFAREIERQLPYQISLRLLEENETSPEEEI